jgi:POLQ-like helicase
MMQELRMLGHDNGSPLAETIPFGVAFHHGGLLMEEREFIERCYRMRRISILCCTSTLAAGVNLPARRVVFRTPYMGREFLTKSRYLQMCGRAGRAGLDSFGESFLILPRRDRVQGHALMQKATEDSSSGLIVTSDGLVDEQPLTRALLECIGVGMFASVATAIGFAKRLLCYVERAERPEMPPGDVSDDIGDGRVDDSGSTASTVTVDDHFARSYEDLVHKALRQLERQRFLTLTAPPAEAEQQLDIGGSTRTVNLPSSSLTENFPLDFTVQATPFGISAVRSCFGIEEAVMIRDELAILQETGVILSDDLHLCYFLTPVREVVDCDWPSYQRILNRMNDTRQRITEALGVNEYYVDQCAMGMPGVMSPAMVNSPFFPSTDALLSDPSKRQLFTVKRFYVAMMLSDLLAETPFDVVEAKYKVNRGQLQSLLKSASMFSSSMTSFCNAMQWYSLEALLSSFVKRLGFGVRPDIVPLMEIKGVQAARARALWNAGFRDAASIASATPTELVERVQKNNPPDSKAAKFFLMKSAVAVIREATKHVQLIIKEKRGELLELTVRSTQPSSRR